ncbi:hypothetical protein BROUX41_004232 [Berkeleyomyces rouxiae]|uniref:uncharacterized protein n=1 Tax=Berkeleyomyces rouxiae TaxID=2035830 RepID=UPI003B7CB44F
MHLLYSISAALVALITAVSAQSQYVISGFKYDGCVEIHPEDFDVTYAHPAGGRTPEDCQYICRGFSYVGVFNDVCRCGNAIGEINRQDEAVCNNPCKGDQSLGWCGAAGPTCDKYANLYCATSTQPVPELPTHPVPFPDRSCVAVTSIEWTALDSYTYTPGSTSSCTLSLTYSYWGAGSESTDGHPYTLTTVTTTLGTYTYLSHTTTEAKTWTTTLSRETAAYTTITFTSTHTSVVSREFTSTAKATYVTTTAASSSTATETQTATQSESLTSGGVSNCLKASFMAAVVAMFAVAFI